VKKENIPTLVEEDKGFQSWFSFGPLLPLDSSLRKVQKVPLRFAHHSFRKPLTSSTTHLLTPKGTGDSKCVVEDCRFPGAGLFHELGKGYKPKLERDQPREGKR